MKTVWIAGMAIAASTSVFAQSTIYKHVDESGRVTYSNKPMKGAMVMELDPITTLPHAAAAPAQKAAPLHPRQRRLAAGPIRRRPRSTSRRRRRARRGHAHAVPARADARFGLGRCRAAEAPRQRPPQDPRRRIEERGGIALPRCAARCCASSRTRSSSRRCASRNRQPIRRPRSWWNSAPRSTRPRAAFAACRPPSPSTRRTSRRSRKSSAL